MGNNIGLGSIVGLLSGGPAMTVTEMEYHVDNPDISMVGTYWFVDGHLHTANFPKFSLTIFVDEETNE